MLESIRLIQIGDIHLPEWQETVGDVDNHDPSFSTEIAGDMTPARLRGVLRRLHQIATKGQIDCILVMGDLTTKGKIQFLAPAVEIIDSLARKLDGSRPPILGVPGNHDVAMDQAATLGKSGKFRPLADAFESCGWSRPPTDDCISQTLKSPNGSAIETFLLNTSVGSWSTHILPAALASEFSADALGGKPITASADAAADIVPTGLKGDYAPKDRTEQLFTQMDTPYVSKRTIDTLSTKLLALESSIGIIIAHHNLLPQRIPRILPYGEMLNGGYFRQLLHKSKRNILYLHGHIHEDPIEIVSTPLERGRDKRERNIVSVGAPAIFDGFNEITLFLGDEGDVFLIRVTKYRPNDLNVIGNFSDQDTYYIPLVRNFGELITGDAKKVWQAIKEARTLNWSELREQATSLKLNEDQIEAVLLKLFCCAVINISQLGRLIGPHRVVQVDC